MRNRIWRFAFGGDIVHVFSRDGKIGHSTCQAPTDDYQVAREIKAMKDPIVREGYLSRHRNCTLARLPSSEKAFGPLNLSALKVCRQIHQEAALLPYQENSFAFLRLIDVESFVKALIPTQARAIRDVVLWPHAPYTKSGFTTLVTKKLQGLRRLTSFVYCDDHGRKPMEEQALRVRAAELLQYRRLPIKSATVAVYRTQQSVKKLRPYPLVPGDVLVGWASEMEKRLTTPWDQAARDQKVAAAKSKAEKAEEAERERRIQNRAGGRLRPTTA